MDTWHSALTRIERFDHEAMRSVRRDQSPSRVAFFRALTVTGTGESWMVSAAALFLLRWARVAIVPDQATFLRAMACALLTYALGQPVKRLVRRRRPFDVLPDYQAHGRAPKDPSFPSLHAGTSMAFFVALLSLGHPLAWPVGLWCVLVSYSRYYLGVHFPSDIAGGWLLGALSGMTAPYVTALLARLVP